MPVRNSMPGRAGRQVAPREQAATATRPDGIPGQPEQIPGTGPAHDIVQDGNRDEYGGQAERGGDRIEQESRRCPRERNHVPRHVPGKACAK